MDPTTDKDYNDLLLKIERSLTVKRMAELLVAFANFYVPKYNADVNEYASIALCSGVSLLNIGYGQYFEEPAFETSYCKSIPSA